jgi:protein O-mannosyl-transferase
MIFNGMLRAMLRIVSSKPLPAIIIFAFLVYLPTLGFGFTDLDDKLLLHTYAPYYQNIANLWLCFVHKFYRLPASPFYRPVFTISCFLNFLAFGQHLLAYHLVNLLLHLIATALIGHLFKEQGVMRSNRTFLTAVFAVHPALVQAVSWLPGRNDSLAAIFIVTFFICSLKYFKNAKLLWLITGFIAFALGCFTKETALVAPFGLLLLIGIQPNNTKFSSRIWHVFLGCIVLLWLWSFCYANIVQNKLPLPKTIAFRLGQNVPYLAQYLGDAVFPLRLSTYPALFGMEFYLGLFAVLILLAFLKTGKAGRILCGTLYFVIFVIPVMISPGITNSTAVFEHRLYLPIVGLLFVVNEAILTPFVKWKPRAVVAAGSVLLLYSGMNIAHQLHFASPLNFWKNAAQTNPHSSVANMMYARYAGDSAIQLRYLTNAMTIDSFTKNLNLNYGCYLQHTGKFAESEHYLRRELAISGNYYSYYFLGLCAMNVHDSVSAVNNFRQFLSTDLATAYHVRYPFQPASNSAIFIMQMLDCRKILQDEYGL